jgi:Glycosyl hydrolases family 2, sugar binding domain/Glycosyl hydrolases family 2
MQNTISIFKLESEKSGLYLFALLILFFVQVSFEANSQDLKSKFYIDLSGTWQFKLDPKNIGEKEGWFKNNSLEDSIKLPGCLQEHGFGNIPDLETIWWGNQTLESWFDESPWLKKYTLPGEFEIQAWLLPMRHYIGAAWYQKEIEIPENWDGKNITLFLERCHWETKFWVDGDYAGSNVSLATPQIFELKNVSPGKHLLTLRVDNSEIIDLGDKAHSVSEQTAGTWNGIVGQIKLKAGSPVWIDNIQVFPDLHKKSIQVKARLVNQEAETSCKWELTADVNGINGNDHNPEPIIQSGMGTNTSFEIVFNYNLGDGTKLWDEFNPNLYVLEININSTIKGKQFTDRKQVTFGMRNFTVKGKQFAINDTLTFLRGNVDCAVTPKTGYAPMDVEFWRRIWKTYKDFGLNMARFHSWCPPEAAFVAADEIGIYLAPEVGEWSSVREDAQLRFLSEESSNILDTYGNHPCFVQLGLGNEMGGDTIFFRKIIDDWKLKDPRHLYTIKANSRANPKNIDYEVVRGTGDGRTSKLRYQGGWPPKPLGSEFITRPPQTVIEWSEALQKSKLPLIQHETAQICAYPDVLNEIPKYTGYLKASYLEIAREQLSENGMLDQLPQFVEASGKWQVELTREEFEAAYRTPEMAGFHWICLADFTGQNTAPVGFTDAFYDAKPYVNPQSVRCWNGPTVLLACIKKRILTTSDNLEASIEISHYQKKNILLNDLTAVLKTEEGNVLKKWNFKHIEFSQGSAQKIDTILYPLKNITAPVKLILTLESKENELENEWNLWVFPDVKPLDFPASIIITHQWDKNTEKELSLGKTVLLLPKIDSLKGHLPVCFTNHYWTSFGENEGQSSASGVLIDNTHPLFRTFPTESHTNWQWWDLLTNCQPFILDSYNTKNPWPKTYRPIVQPIDSWKINRKLALVAEVKMGKGKMIICSIDIETDIQNRPASKEFRKCLIKYLLSSEFDPQTEVSFENVKEIFDDQGKINKTKFSNMPDEG